ncbi:MAG: hypothetical protein JJ901_03355 [Erythrobacter sp.]|uniref:hypothetical protein n=1 Tax=Erythrobacter sp. TaxID=1042 RepID=UPI001B1225F6|nr:hypothetical protein [Erythrobacter sp.]MBO6767326.1 hypothetical protein [Erythrobacter sp.]
MSEIASEMVEQSGETFQLTETMSSTRILEIASGVFETPCTDIAATLAVTLLSPVSLKYRGAVPVRFTHRAFQEFYLAKSIVAEHADPSCYPSAVQSLANELAAAEASGH